VSSLEEVGFWELRGEASYVTGHYGDNGPVLKTYNTLELQSTGNQRARFNFLSQSADGK